MSDELRLPDELAACEARLAAQALPATAINRDELMYRAGWAAGVETTRLAALNSALPKSGTSGGIRLVAASLTSAAVAASLAVWTTWAWQATDVVQVVGDVTRPEIEAAISVEAPQRPTVDVIAAEPTPSELRVRPAIDVGLLGLRTRALNQVSLSIESITASNGELSAPAAKTARELLDEMLPATDQERPSWPWVKNFAGDAI